MNFNDKFKQEFDQLSNDDIAERVREAFIYAVNRTDYSAVIAALVAEQNKRSAKTTFWCSTLISGTALIISILSIWTKR